MYKSLLTTVYKVCSNQLVKNTGSPFSGDQLLSGKKILSSNTFTRTLYETPLQNDLEDEKSKWMKYNDKIFPPQAPGEERRPAYVCHEIKNIKYSEKKMWYVAMLIRGMSVDEARRQLKQVHRKGATAVTKALNEAVEMAIKDHGVEFKTDLWVAESFTHKGVVLKGIRRCAKAKVGIIHYRYCNYYIRLEEGVPPPNYYSIEDRTGPGLLEKWLKGIRSRKICNTL